MSNNPILDAIPDGSTASRSQVRDALARASFLPVSSLSDVQNMNMALAGTPYAGLLWNGQFFRYDPDDVTSSDDGTSVLVSDDGRRYKVTQQYKYDGAVLDKDITAPPSSPAFGDSYIVPVAATGDWAGFDKYLATRVYGRWLFTAPYAGMHVFVEDEDRFYHYANSAVWTAGLGAGALPDSSVTMRQLRERFGYRVQGEQNTPPVSMPVAGVAFIVGQSPTGDWAGEAGKIAESDGSSWFFYTPSTGMQIYDLAVDLFKVFRGGEWTATSSALVQLINVNIDDVVYTVNTPNNTHQVVKAFPFTLLPGDYLFFDVVATFALKGNSVGASGTGFFYLKRDNELINLAETTVPSNISTSFGLDRTLTLDQKIFVDDNAAHAYNFGFKADYSGAPIVTEVRLKIIGLIYVYRGTLVES